MKLAPRVAAAALAIMLAIPAVADAKASHVSVNGHVKKAHHALIQVIREAAVHHNGAAKTALRVARHESAAASRAARAVHGSAAVRANGYAKVAVQYNEDVSIFTGLLGHTGGSLQGLLGAGLQPSLSGRQQALSSLQGLLGSLPAGMLPDFSSLITSIIGATAGQASTLAGLLGGGLPGGIQGLVEQALATATGIATAGIAQVEQLLSILPADQRAAIKAALDQIVMDLSHLSDVLAGILGTPAAPAPGTPTTPACPTTPAPATGGLGGIGGLLGAPLAILAQTQQFLQQILGIVLGGGPTAPAPACGATTTPTPGGFLPFPGFLQSILGGLGLGGLGLGGIGLGGLL